MNIIEVAHVLNLTTLIEYLNSSGLSATLSEDLGPITLFAPSNKAFEDLPASVKRTLREDPAKLQDILSYHLILERKWTYEFGKDNLVNSANIPNKLRLNSFRYGKVQLNEVTLHLKETINQYLSVKQQFKLHNLWALRASLAICHLMSKKRKWNNCFIKNTHKL